MGFWNWIKKMFGAIFNSRGANKGSLEEIVTESPVQSNVIENVNGNFDYSTPWDSAVYPDLIEVLLAPIKENPELGISEEVREEYSKKFGENDELYARVFYPNWNVDDAESIKNEGIFDIKEREDGKGIKFYQKIMENGREMYIRYTISTEPIEEKLAPGLQSLTPLRKASEEEKAYQRKLAGELVNYLGLKPASQEAGQEVEERVEEAPPQPTPAPAAPILQEASSEVAGREKLEEMAQEATPQQPEQVPQPQTTPVQPAQPEPPREPAEPSEPAVPRAPFYDKAKDFGRKYGKVLKGAGLAAAIGLVGWGAYYLSQNVNYGAGRDGQNLEREKIVSVSGSKSSQSAQPSTGGSSPKVQIQVTKTAQPAATQTPNGSKGVKGTLEDKVQKDKINEYEVKRGDNLWEISEGYGVKGIPSFIKLVVDYQLSHSKDSAFKQRIARDTIYVKNGRVRYGENVDGIRGDNLRVGDVIMVPQQLVEEYKTGKGAKGGATYNLSRGAQKHGKVRAGNKGHGEEARNYQSTTSYGDQVVGLAVTGDNKPILTFTRKIAGQKEKEFEKILGRELHQVPYIAGKTGFGSYHDSLYGASRRKQSK